VALTDTFIKNAKPNGTGAGVKHTDGGGMYLLVKSAGQIWQIFTGRAGSTSKNESQRRTG
jgi:hypothetical protein